MLNDGRIKGVKIGNHWRFSRAEIGRLLGEPSSDVETEPTPILNVSDFPTDCVERMQGVFAGILGVGAITVNLNGEPLTEPVFSNQFCRMMLSNPSSRKACQGSWRKIALRTAGNPAFHVCHAGLCYMRSEVKMEDKNVAWMVTGQFFIAPQLKEKIQKKIEEIAKQHSFQYKELEEAAKGIPVLKHSQQLQVQEWAPKVAATVQSMLCERLDLVNRLERIAEISAIRPSLKNNSEKEGV